MCGGGSYCSEGGYACVSQLNVDVNLDANGVRWSNREEGWVRLLCVVVGGEGVEEVWE